ncbi:MAG TPA: hypothetical protein VF170_02735 [Planctomycetaceae bacterium]
MSSPLVRRVRLGVLVLILIAATTATASNRRRAGEPQPIRVSDRVRLKDDLFGPTWYVIKRWEYDALIDNGTDQIYLPLSEIVRDTD